MGHENKQYLRDKGSDSKNKLVLHDLVKLGDENLRQDMNTKVTLDHEGSFRM